MERSRKTFAAFAIEFAWAILPCLVLASNVPWGYVFLDTIPTGGDNPAHPVMMQSVKESLLRHLSIIHYSYSFWGGFELFQFYFPLPYVSGALFSLLIPFNCAFKLVTVIPLVALPLSFYVFARALACSRVLSMLSALIGISFLFTRAHMMWGGNIFSDLAGMIGNSWGMAFLVPILGISLRGRETRSFSLAAAVLTAGAIASHFYAFLLIAIYYGIFALKDALEILRRRLPLKSILPFYAGPLIGALSMAWWIIPLFHYKAFSSDFGSNWDVDFLGTFRLQEKVVFGAAILAAFALITVRPKQSRVIGHLLDFLAVNVLLYFSGRIVPSTAFINVRLWPSVYLSCHLLLVATLAELMRLFPRVAGVLAFAIVYALLPQKADFSSTRQGMEANFRGLQQTQGWPDLQQIARILNSREVARVSFESSAANNWLLGTIRAFELLPLLTHHEIIEGGILNSASFPGVAYSLQCLTSSTCAGWPAGSIMSAKDGADAIGLMRSLGVSYHITATQQNEWMFIQLPETRLIFRGQYFSLFELRDRSPLVEVFSEPGPVVPARDFHLYLVNANRWDALRGSLLLFGEEARAAFPSYVPSPLTLFNFLSGEWREGRRVVDAGYPDRAPRTTNFLNSYLFTSGKQLDLAREIDEGLPRFFIADRSIDPDLLVSNQQQKRSEVAAVLRRDEGGAAPVIFDGKGYRILFGNRELSFGTEERIEFTPLELGGASAPLAVIRFVPIPSERYRYIDIRSSDPAVSNLFPGGSEVRLPENITAACAASVQRSFGRIELKTGCRGKMHLIKYSYYPKWRADVPLYRGTNGFIALVPEKESVILEHRQGTVDLFASCLSGGTILAVMFILGLGLHRGRGPAAT